MTALYWILGVLLFLFLLTLIPVRLEVGFRQEFSLTVRYLFLRFPLLPGKEKEPEEKAAKEEKEGESGKLKQILSRTGFWGFLKSLFELTKMAASSGKRLISRFRWKRFDLYLCLGGAGDAAEAAQLYGQLSGAVYAGCGVLFGATGCKKKGVTVDLDYTSEENLVDFSALLSLRPIYVLKEGVSLLIKGLPVLKGLLGTGGRSRNQKGKVSGNERKQSQ